MSESRPSLPDDQHYNEAMSYQLSYGVSNPGEVYQYASEQFDKSRKILNNYSDQDIKELHRQGEKLVVEVDDTNPIDTAIWNMPFIDEDRAFAFYEDVLTDPDADTMLLSSVGSGMRQITFADPVRSVRLWKLGFANERIDDDRLSNGFWSAAQSVFGVRSENEIPYPKEIEKTWAAFTDKEKSATLVNRTSILKKELHDRSAGEQE